MRDPNSYIQASAEALAETLLSKNSDYAPSGEFSNFEKAAKIAGIYPLQAMLSQAAIKMTRIETLLGCHVRAKFDQENYERQNESLKDSFLDLAGYAIIAHAYLSANESVNPVDPFGTPDPHWLVRDEG